MLDSATKQMMQEQNKNKKNNQLFYFLIGQHQVLQNYGFHLFILKSNVYHNVHLRWN